MSPLQIVLRVNQASQTALLVVGMSLQLLAKQPLNAPRMGIEPTTFRLRVKCLIHLATELSFSKQSFSPTKHYEF